MHIHADDTYISPASPLDWAVHECLLSARFWYIDPWDLRSDACQELARATQQTSLISKRANARGAARMCTRTALIDSVRPIFGELPLETEKPSV